MDTRTPRTSAGGGPSGFDDGPALSMVKVPCDPAQVIVSHASFRVQLPTAQQTQSPRVARQLALAGLAADTARIPAVGAAAVRRRAPVVWSGKSEPGDPGASGLLRAVRTTGVQYGAGPDDRYDGAATQVIPRVTEAPPPYVIGPREPEDPDTRILPRVQTSGSAYDEAAYAYRDLGRDGEDAEGTDERSGRRHAGDSVRHAYYPGRGLNLGVVLLPLRIFLGFIAIYAGMGKLCDPVYFDGGERGSMVKWLNSLHPWALAEPMRDWALQHPVGAGLGIAFLQVIVGVLTVLGLWQRVAAVIGGLLCAALLVTVSWKTVPVYGAPDIIYLAAWSPLIIAGAPVYSVDGWLASEAWRRLGPRAELWELRRRVLRRGILVGAVVLGLTLLLGSLLGGAVRDADRVTAPGPGESPRNERPGSPLPTEPEERWTEQRTPSATTGAPTQGNTASPSTPATTPGAATESGSVGTVQPSQTQGTWQQQPPPQESAPPSTSSGPTSSGGTGSGGTGSEEPGLVGGLLG